MSMRTLQVAAEAGEVAFVRAANHIDWLQRPAADFARAVHLALAVRAHLLARKLAAQGASLHPDHPELKRMARILAPPVYCAQICLQSLRCGQTWHGCAPTQPGIGDSGLRWMTVCSWPVLPLRANSSSSWLQRAAFS
jgi:hypothetical protein